MKAYLLNLSAGRIILWCYVAWYSVMVGLHFEGRPALWVNSFGLCLIVGFALVLATGPLSKKRFTEQRWPIFRLFLCPFCVSSFSALTTGKGFILLLSPSWQENMAALLACLLISLLVFSVRYFCHGEPQSVTRVLDNG
jgi:hypothetical protein